MTDRMRGVITPILTPYNDDLTIATDLYLAHAADCLAGGAHYLSPFGTTSEALSHSPRERMEALDLLVSSGTARPDQLMPGTGLNSLEETLTLSRHAVELGCAAVMTLPPFFYVTASDEGLYRYFSQLVEAIASDALKICLYHIPQNTRHRHLARSGGAAQPRLSRDCGGLQRQFGRLGKHAGGDRGRAGHFRFPRFGKLSDRRNEDRRRRLHFGQLQFERGGDPGHVRSCLGGKMGGGRDNVAGDQHASAGHTGRRADPGAEISESVSVGRCPLVEPPTAAGKCRSQAGAGAGEDISISGCATGPAGRCCQIECACAHAGSLVVCAARLLLGIGAWGRRLGISPGPSFPTASRAGGWRCVRTRMCLPLRHREIQGRRRQSRSA